MDNLHLITTCGVILNETEEGRIGAKPLDHVHLEFVLRIRCFSDQRKSAARSSLRVVYVRCRAMIILRYVIWSKDVKGEMFVPLLHDLESVAREGSDGGQKMTILVDVGRQNKIVICVRRGCGRSTRR